MARSGVAAGAAGDRGPTGGDEGGEQPLLVGVVLGRVLGVPLHAEDPCAGQLHGLYRSVGGPAAGNQPVTKAVDGLVVNRVTDRVLVANGNRRS